MNHLIPSFNAGELSPRLVSRPDLDKYGAGCRELQNFLIMPYGGVNRRPGTQWMGATKVQNRRARLLGFNFSTSTNYVLEFGHLYCRFWSRDGQVMNGGSPLEIATPYSEEEAFEFQFIQVNDVLFLVHPNHPPRTLSRLAATNWELKEAAWDWPAVLDTNIEETTLKPSAATGAITLTASASLFKAGHVGSYWMLTQRREATSVSLPFTVSGTSDPVQVVGNWDLNTRGTWEGTLWVERSLDDGDSWEIIRTYKGKKDRNLSTSGSEEEECRIRLRYSFISQETNASSPAPAAYFEAYNTSHDGVVKITKVNSGTVAEAVVVKDLVNDSETKNWAEGAWSTERGFPRTVCLHEQRIFYGGTRHKPQTIWASVIGDFYNFKLGSKDDDALSFTLASAETNSIAWMVSQQALCIGTAGDEYILAASSDGAITPTNLKVQRQSHFGSKYAPALVANDVALFIQRQGRKIREFVYEFQKDGYVAADLTLLADHITEGGVVQTAYQQQPDAILWCVTGAGTLAGMTYERAQNVVGWHRHTTAGVFESVATIYSPDAADEVWVIVKRGNARYVERFEPGYRETLEAEDKAGWWYLDCASRVEFETPTATVSGLARFNGQTVEVLADGTAEEPKVVSGGQITLQHPARNVLVGLPYASVLRPMPLDPGPLPNGSAQSRKFRVHRLVLRVYKSLGGEVETGPGLWDAVHSRSSDDRMDDSPPVFTGDKEVGLARGYEPEGTVAIRQLQPLPLTLLGIIPKYEITGT